MKRIALLIYLTTFALASAFAVPAKQGLAKHTQKDGTVVTYRVVGDEFNNRIIIDDLYTAIQGEDGDIYYAAPANGGLVNSGVLVRPFDSLSSAEKQVARESIGIQSYAFNPHFNRTMHSRDMNVAVGQHMAAAAKAPGAPNEAALELGRWGGEVKGQRNMLVILVEYTDVKFSIKDPQAKFHAMLNDPGYSDNNATGSARDYYMDNSNNQFKPQFDVYGPYTLSHERKYYGGNDSYGNDQRPGVQTKEACDLAAANGADLSKYDNNGDGDIDLAFIVYAGHNPAEHGPADAVWPHMSYIYPGVNIVENYTPTYNGKRLYNYACTSELQGRSGAIMAGIGTFCHEFGHAIGLPDFYDVDYSGGFGMGYASIMDQGSYLNSGATPPAYNTLERWLLGWNLPQEIVEAGTYELEHVSKKGGMIMWANDTKDECFLFEARPKNNNFGWDKYFNEGYEEGLYQGGEGLLILRVDWSGIWYNKWQGNDVNNDPQHQCATIFKSNPTADSNASRGWFFPGSRNVTELSHESTPALLSWEGRKMPYYFTGIAINGSKVVFNAMLKDLNLNVRQYDALIDWSASEHNATKWNVVTTDHSNEEQTQFTTTNKHIVLQPLHTDTNYSVAIYADNNGEATYELNFTTLSNVFTPRSALQLDKEFEVADKIRLSVKNLECTPEQIVWKVDGKVVEPYLNLSAGKHKVVAEITDTEGNTHFLWRYITVK